MSGYKFDTEVGLINRVKDHPKFKLLPNKNVSGFLHDESSSEKKLPSLFPLDEPEITVRLSTAAPML